MRIMQNTQVRKDGTSNRIFDSHHSIIGLAAFNLASHFTKGRTRVDFDIRTEAAIRYNMVETAFITLYGHFQFFVHFASQFVFRASTADQDISKKSRSFMDRDRYNDNQIFVRN